MSVEVLHITAHLGGGVGKVLSRLTEESARRADGLHHTIACLERLEKDQFAAHVEAYGGELLRCPSLEILAQRVVRADIVQLEWWHHPVVAGWLCSGVLPPMRLVVWTHVSGLVPPEIPPQFATIPHRFLFSSPCSWEQPRLAGLGLEARQRIAAVFSSGGFADLAPPPERDYAKPLRVGYVGTMNLAKLHPRIIDFLKAVDVEGFKLSMVGDPTNGDALLAEARAAGVGDRIEIVGYSTNITEILGRLDVMAYLLNPLHYGTAENALLEAMAMGVVPIVLHNPAERQLVAHGETGLVVDSPESFAAAMRRLASSVGGLKKLATAASRDVRERFSVERTSDALMSHYRAVVDEPKRTFDFIPVFGNEPADWFMACQGAGARFFTAGDAGPVAGALPHYLFEESKGSVFHYQRTYPNDERLRQWAGKLRGAK